MTNLANKHGGLLAVLLLSLVTSTFQLGAKPLWNDEAFSFFVAHDGPGQAIFNISTDPQPPLYYVILSLVLPLGGSPFIIRIPSALALVISTGFVYGAASLLFNRRVGLIAGMLLAINPDLVDFAQKGRPYAAQAMFVALAFWGMAKVHTDEAAMTRWMGSSLRRASPRGHGLGADLGWTAYILGAAGAMLSQHPGGFFVLSANVVALARIAVEGRAAHRWMINWIVAQIIMLMIWALWLPGFISQMSELIGANGIAPRRTYPITAGAMLGEILTLYSVGSVWTARFGAWSLYLGGLAFGLLALWRNRFAGIVVLIPAVLPILIGVLGFYAIGSIVGYAITTMHWIAVPYVVIIAAGIGSLRGIHLRIAAAACFVVANAWGLRNYYETPNPPTDALVRVIAEQARPGDGIIFSEQTVPRFVVGYYLGGKIDGLRGLDLSRDGAALIRSLDDARKNPRNWIILAGDQRSAVDVDRLSGSRQPDFRQDFGAYTLLRVDAPTSQ